MLIFITCVATIIWLHAGVTTCIWVLLMLKGLMPRIGPPVDCARSGSSNSSGQEHLSTWMLLSNVCKQLIAYIVNIALVKACGGQSGHHVASCRHRLGSIRIHRQSSTTLAVSFTIQHGTTAQLLGAEIHMLTLQLVQVCWPTPVLSCCECCALLFALQQGGKYKDQHAHRASKQKSDSPVISSFSKWKFDNRCIGIACILEDIEGYCILCLFLQNVSKSDDVKTLGHMHRKCRVHVFMRLSNLL